MESARLWWRSMSKDQISLLYEEQGQSAAAIATSLGLSLEVVEASLQRNSAKYLQDAAAKANDHISDRELQYLYKRMLWLAKQDEDPRLAFQAAAFLIDDKRGRKDKVAITNVTNNNVFQQITQKIESAANRRALELQA